MIEQASQDQQPGVSPPIQTRDSAPDVPQNGGDKWQQWYNRREMKKTDKTEATVFKWWLQYKLWQHPSELTLFCTYT
jgi:hypothetical protein